MSSAKFDTRKPFESNWTQFTTTFAVKKSQYMYKIHQISKQLPFASLFQKILLTSTKSSKLFFSFFFYSTWKRIFRPALSQYEIREQIIHLTTLWYTLNGAQRRCNSSNSSRERERKKTRWYLRRELFISYFVVNLFHAFTHTQVERKLQGNLCDSFSKMGRKMKCGANQIRRDQNEFFVCLFVLVSGMCVCVRMYTVRMSCLLFIYLFFFFRLETIYEPLCMCVCCWRCCCWLLTKFLDVLCEMPKPTATEMGACWTPKKRDCYGKFSIEFYSSTNFMLIHIKHNRIWIGCLE